MRKHWQKQDWLTAILAWCAAAGTAGASFPVAIATVARKRAVPPMTAGDIVSLMAEATDLCHETAGDDPIAPRGFCIDLHPGWVRLIWDTSVETILTCAPMASNGSAYMLTIQAHLGDEPTDAIRESIATRAAAARAAMG